MKKMFGYSEKKEPKKEERREAAMPAAKRRKVEAKERAPFMKKK